MTHFSDTPTAIEIYGLSKSYGRKRVIRDFSLDLAEGEVLGFLGPNGAGKTTTIKALMGLIRRDSGDINVLGFDPAVDGVNVKSRVGYVPEQHFIHGWMRVSQVVSFCRAFYPTWNDKLCGELIEHFRLDPAQRVRHLSKGTVVKLSLVLAMSHEPQVLILDEPMAGLDPVMREEVLDGLLRTISDRGRTILFSSHTLSDVQRMADSIAIIDEGELLVKASVDDLLARTKRIRAVLSDGSEPRKLPEGVVWQRVENREWLVTVNQFSADVVECMKAGNQLAHIEVVDLGLEDIFKDYVRGRRAAS